MSDYYFSILQGALLTVMIGLGYLAFRVSRRRATA